MKTRLIDWLLAVAFGLALSWMAADGAADDVPATETTLPAAYIATANQ